MADSPELDLGATIRSFGAGQRVFRRYTLKKMLGRGGMGVVWLARDEELEREVALKFLPELLVCDPAAVAELKQETRRALELTHPGIVRVYDFHQASGMAGLSMEWVDGHTLTELRMQRTPPVFAPRELAPWISQLAEALDYAHTRARVVHRDLKPANVMVNRRGEVKIADFGISASVSETVTRVSRVAAYSGTPLYMSPQQLLGRAPTPTDDIYSVGATLYELLAGKPPFFRGDVHLQITQEAPPPLAARRRELGFDGDAIPPGWEEAIAAALAKDPAHRPGSVADLWRRMKAEAPTPAPIPGVSATPENAHESLSHAATVLSAGSGVAAETPKRPAATPPPMPPRAAAPKTPAPAPAAAAPSPKAPAATPSPNAAATPSAASPAASSPASATPPAAAKPAPQAREASRDAVHAHAPASSGLKRVWALIREGVLFVSLMGLAVMMAISAGADRGGFLDFSTLWAWTATVASSTWILLFLWRMEATTRVAQAAAGNRRRWTSRGARIFGRVVFLLVWVLAAVPLGWIGWLSVKSEFSLPVSGAGLAAFAAGTAVIVVGAWLIFRAGNDAGALRFPGLRWRFRTRSLPHALEWTLALFAVGVAGLYLGGNVDGAIALVVWPAAMLLIVVLLARGRGVLLLGLVAVVLGALGLGAHEHARRAAGRKDAEMQELLARNEAEQRELERQKEARRIDGILAVPSEYATLAEAVADARSGDTIRLAGGQYDAPAYWPSGVNLVGDARDAVVLRAGPTGPALSLTGAAPFRVSQLTVEHTGTSEDERRHSLVMVWNGTAVIEDVLVRNANGYGLYIDANSDAVLRRVTVAKSRWGGALAIGGAAARLENCEFRDNTQHGLELRSDTAETTKGGVIRVANCMMTGNGMAGVRVSGAGLAPAIVNSTIFANTADGIQIADGAKPLIQGNQIRDNRSRGIVISAAAAPVIDGNVVEKNDQSGVEVYGGSTPRIERNRLLGNKLNGLYVDASSPQVIANEASGNELHGLALRGAGNNAVLESNRAVQNKRAGIIWWEGAQPVIRSFNQSDASFLPETTGGGK